MPNFFASHVTVSLHSPTSLNIDHLLDEIIADRRKEQVKALKQPKKVSTVDRSIATGKAKREAAVKAKRGLSETKKPSAMEVEREVYRQSRRTEVTKAKREQKAAGGKLPPNPILRDRKNKKKGGGGGNAGAPAAPSAIFGGRVPPRKAVEAAVAGMESAGFKIPDGHQVYVAFVPVPVAAEKPDPKGKRGPAGKW
jgi:hypothetical protein